MPASYQILEPQDFDPRSFTQLPEIDFYNYVKTNLPGVMQNASNFMGVIEAITAQFQYLYDILRSTQNVNNLNNTDGDPNYPSYPVGYYLNLLAVDMNAQYSAGSLSTSIYNSIQNTVSYVNARGTIQDFYNYFVNNGLLDYFDNIHIQLDPNATLVFYLPIANTPLTPPNPYAIFKTAMELLKAMGVEVIVVGKNIPYLQYGSLPTDVPPYEVAPGNAGYGVLLQNGEVVNGGFIKSL